MSGSKLILGMAIASVLGAGSVVRAEEPSNTQLQQELAKLRAELNELKTQTTASADVDATVARVMAESNKRSTMMAEGLTAGYDGGFFLASEDGSFRLSPIAEFQFRNVTNSTDGFFSDSADVQNGFEIRRARFGVKGTAFSPDLKYNFRFGFDRNDGNPDLENAFIEYKFRDNWSLIAGQFKSIPFHEENVSSFRQQAAERSLVNEVLGGGVSDYVQGAGLMYEEGPVAVTVAFTDGVGSRNTNYLDEPETRSDYGVEGRAEYTFFGDKKKNYQDLSSWGVGEDLLVVGVGADYSEAGDTWGFLHTVDVQYKNTAGWSIYAAYLGNWNDDGNDDSYDAGALAQVGYLIPDSNWEVFGRYDIVLFDDDTGLDDDNFHELTAGVNYYYQGHNAKFTLDFTYLPNGSPFSITGSGFTDSTDDQWIIRGQFQLQI